MNPQDFVGSTVQEPDDASADVTRPDLRAGTLEAAIAVVVAMSDDDFFDAADRIGLDPFSGMNRGRFVGVRGSRTLSQYRIRAAERAAS